MKKAFTLAEVLITLGIIGIVAAMTMPSLIAKHQEKTTVTKLKKIYSVLSQSYLSARAEKGPLTDYVTIGEASNDILIYLKPYLKISQDCTETKCNMHEHTKMYLNGTVATEKVTTEKGLILSDGALLLPGNILSDCTSKTVACSVIQVITEPYSRNYILGRNWFQFNVFADRIEPNGLTETGFKNTCSVSKGGNQCAAWVIFNENMDYLHCDDLSWTGKNKCD